MTHLLLILAGWLLLTGQEDRVLLCLLAALVCAVLRLQPGPLRRMWRDALARERQGDGTLFSGSRDDDT